MATNAPTTGAPTRATASLAVNHSRRTLLGSALLVPIAATACLAPSAAATLASDLPRLIATLDAAERARDHYEASVYEPAYDAWKAAVTALPHHTTVISFINVSGRETRFSTDSESNVATARRMCRERPAWLSLPENADYRATCEEIAAAADDRQRTATSLQDRFALDVKWDEMDRLCDATAEALDAVVAFQPTTISDLALKLAALEERGGLSEPSWMVAVRDDVRRLAGEGR